MSGGQRINDQGSWIGAKGKDSVFPSGPYKTMNEFGELSVSFNNMADVISKNIIQKEKQAQELMLVNKELTFRINELSQYSYITNHDLREPLSAMTHFTQLLQENFLLEMILSYNFTTVIY